MKSAHVDQHISVAEVNSEIVGKDSEQMIQHSGMPISCYMSGAHVAVGPGLGKERNMIVLKHLISRDGNVTKP
jgi:hypothetical protein